MSLFKGPQFDGSGFRNLETPPKLGRKNDHNLALESLLL